jgi:hypothetical protein
MEAGLPLRRAEWKKITEKAKNPQRVVMPVKEEEVKGVTH